MHHFVNPSGQVYCILDEADAGERTLEEVADILGLSKERVRQIETKVMRRLGRHQHLRVLRD